MFRNVLKLDGILTCAYFVIYLVCRFFDLKTFFLLVTLALLVYSVGTFIKNIRDHIIFLLFNGVITLFLVTRPVIMACRGEDWFTYSIQATWIALFIVGLSIISVKIGYTLWCKKFPVRAYSATEADSIRHFKTKLYFFHYLAFLLLKYIVEINRYLFFKEKAYTSIYTATKGAMPTVVTSLADLTIIFLMAYLAMIPSKKRVFIALTAYLFALVPGLLLGERNNIASFLLISLVYVVFRDRMSSGKRWLTKRVVIGLLASVPLLVMLFSAVNYVRDHQKIEKNHNPAVQFLYLQGTSFDTVKQGIMYVDNFPKHYPRMYSFGNVIDTARDNLVVRAILNKPSYGNGNNLSKVYDGYTLAHPLSYFALGSSYLNGHGRGSSYVVENYVDANVVGVLVFGVLLGMEIGLTQAWLYGRFWQRLVALLSLTSLFLLPRSGYSSNLTIFVNPKSLLVILYLIFLAHIIDQQKLRGKPTV